MIGDEPAMSKPLESNGFSRGGAVKKARMMTPKQARFVDEYLIDLNATQASIRAGYSRKTADRIGPELLGKPCVSRAIAERRAELSERAQRTVDAVMADLARVRESAMQEVEDQDTGVMVMVSYKDALRALELEGKHLGMFTDKVEIAATGIVWRGEE